MILYVDACVRSCSRTRQLAQFLLEHLPKEEIQRMTLYPATIPPPSEELLQLREASQKSGTFTHPYFDLAKQLMQAETVVIAAPYWDLSFPSLLKSWLEAVCVSGLTFSYGADNLPHSHCKLKTLYYVTTAGGPILQPDHGFDYVRLVMESFFGAVHCRCFAAEHLDEVGAQPDKILQSVMNEMDSFFGKL